MRKIKEKVVHVFITPGVRMRTKEFEGFFGVNNHPGNKKFVTINHVLTREGKFILKRIYHMKKKNLSQKDEDGLDGQWTGQPLHKKMSWIISGMCDMLLPANLF